MEKIYLGMAGHVVCLRQKDGTEIWRQKLKSSQITNVVLDGDKIYAASAGQLFCLSAKDGNILWQNGLKGLGYGACIISTSSQNANVMAANLQAQQTAGIAAISATTVATNN